MYFLEGLGFTLERVNEKSISISRPDLKRNIRLKGAIYADGFKGLSQRPEIIESMQEDYERVSDSRGIRDLMIWKKGMEMKKEYHQKRYGDIKAPEPLNLTAVSSSSDKHLRISEPNIDTGTPQRSYVPRP